MNQSVLYSKLKSLVMKDSVPIFKKNFHLINQHKDRMSTLLDIGCGPGHVTHDLFHPLFEAPISKVIGIDVTKNMIDYANALYANDTFFFEVIDIGKEVPQKYVSYFDYVFSSWALNWIRDQRQMYANINQVMKPQGQILLLYVAQSELFDIYQIVWHKPEYSLYISDFNLGQSCFQKSEDPKKELEVILKDTGFQIDTLNIEKTVFSNLSASEFKDFLTSINPVLHLIPGHLKEQFMWDHVELLQRDSSNKYILNFDGFVVCATKK